MFPVLDCSKLATIFFQFWVFSVIFEYIVDLTQDCFDCPLLKLLVYTSGNEDLIDEASQDQETREPQTSAEAKGTELNAFYPRIARKKEYYKNCIK